MVPIGIIYDNTNHLLYLPRGIDLWYVRKTTGINEESVEKSNPYRSIGNMLMKYSPRDPEQLEALQFMTGIGQYENNNYEPQLSVNLPTGAGKTYCSIATIAYMKIKSMVITGSNTLLHQWKQDILEYTNLSDNDIMFISGSSKLYMILQDKSKIANNAKIFLCTHGTIRSFAETYGWEKLNDVFLALGIGMKFIDEYHTNWENSTMIDYFTNVYKTYYVTATPARSDRSENRIFQISLKNVPSIDLFEKAEQRFRHTDYLAIKYNSHPSPIDISRCRNIYGLDRNKYVDYVTKKQEFYDMLRIILDMVFKIGGRALFYIGTNEGLLRVYKWMGENYPEMIGDIGIYTSLVDKDHKIYEKDKKYLLSTTKSAGLGEDIKGLKTTIVLAEPFKSEVLARQTLGRTRDPNTLYIELVDLGFRQLRRYYEYKVTNVFQKYANDISDTMIMDYEMQQRVRKIMEKRENKFAHCPIYFHDDRFFDYPEDHMQKKEMRNPIYFEK